MIPYRKSVFVIIFMIRGSVIPRILPLCLVTALLGIIGFLISLINQSLCPPTLGVPALFPISPYCFSLNLPSDAHTVLGFVLGVLIVFRTTFAFNKYENGNSYMRLFDTHLYTLCAECFNFYEDEEEVDKLARGRIRELLTITRCLTLAWLRGEEDLSRKSCVCKHDSEVLESMSPYRRVRFMLSEFSKLTRVLQNNGKISDLGMLVLSTPFNGAVEQLSNIHSVQSIPFPFPYAQLTTVFLLFYVLTFPLAFASLLGIFVIPISVLVTLAFFGLNEVSMELEDPFGEDPNDLPLDDTGYLLDQLLGDLHRSRDGGTSPDVNAAKRVYFRPPKQANGETVGDKGSEKQKEEEKEEDGDDVIEHVEVHDGNALLPNMVAGNDADEDVQIEGNMSGIDRTTTINNDSISRPSHTHNRPLHIPECLFEYPKSQMYQKERKAAMDQAMEEVNGMSVSQKLSYFKGGSSNSVLALMELFHGTPPRVTSSSSRNLDEHTLQRALLPSISKKYEEALHQRGRVD